MATLSLIWRAAGLLLATDVESVIEVLPPVATRPVPGEPEWLRGLFVHRGQLIPLIDATRLLERSLTAKDSPRSDRMRNRVLALRLPAAENRSAWRLGLWVESLLDLERIEFTGPGTHPGFATDDMSFLGPVAATRFGLVQLLTPDKLLTPEHLDVLTRRISEAAA